MDLDLPLEIVSSRRYALGGLAGCLAFAALGAGLIALDGGSADRWGGVAFFGGGSLVFVRPALRPRVEMTIAREGLRSRRARSGTVRWEDVTRAWLARVSGQPILCLELDRRLAAASPSRWRRFLSRVGRALGVGDACILLGDLQVDAEDVLALVARHARLAPEREGE